MSLCPKSCVQLHSLVVLGYLCFFPMYSLPTRSARCVSVPCAWWNLALANVPYMSVLSSISIIWSKKEQATVAEYGIPLILLATQRSDITPASTEVFHSAVDMFVEIESQLWHGPRLIFWLSNEKLSGGISLDWPSEAWAIRANSSSP